MTGADHNLLWPSKSKPRDVDQLVTDIIPNDSLTFAVDPPTLLRFKPYLAAR